MILGFPFGCFQVEEGLTFLTPRPHEKAEALADQLSLREGLLFWLYFKGVSKSVQG